MTLAASIASATMALSLLGASVFQKGDPFKDLNKRLNELGIGIPTWLLDPDYPARPGDGRPTTPMADTSSYMLHISIAKSGAVEKCEVLMSRGPEPLGEGFCKTSMEKMHFEPTDKNSAKVFWVHAYTNPSSGDVNVQYGPDVPLKPRK